MSPCVVDWQLVIDGFGTLATVGIAIWAIKAGISTFKKQKTIEIRIEWYRKMHEKILELSMLAAHIKSDALPSVRNEKIATAIQAGSDLSALVQDAWMFADQAGFVAMQHLSEQIALFGQKVQRGALDVAGCDQLSLTCFAAANALAGEFRKELDLKRVTVQPGINITHGKFIWPGSVLTLPPENEK